MTRRLRFIGVACLSIALPACITVPSEQAMRPYPHNPQRHLPGVKVNPKGETAPNEQFASGRAKTPLNDVPLAPIPNGEPMKDVKQVKETPVEAPVKDTKELDTVGYKPDRTEPARIVLPPLKGDTNTPIAESIPDKDGVIRSDWPKIPTIKDAPPIGESAPLVSPAPVETPKPIETTAPGPLLAPPTPNNDTPVVAPPVIPPLKAPETLPPSMLSVPNHQTRSSPLSNDPMSNEMRLVSERESTMVTQNDSTLIKAIRALQENRPAEAANAFRQNDPATQQLLLALLPPVLHLAEGKLATMKAEEVDVLLDQLTRVPNMLRTKASLHVNNAILCREVHCFAKIEPFPTRHQFRAGDMVHLYVELANFSCLPDPKGGYGISLASSLEVRDAAGSLVWRADPKEEADRVTTAPMDYYRAYRFSVPNLAGGTYTLGIRIVDRPTGREVRKNIEFRVGAK